MSPEPEQAFDYVGIAIARSVEGDALVEAMSLVDGVEIVPQHSYWEIKAHERLRLDFEELSDETGLDVDSELIQVPDVDLLRAHGEHRRGAADLPRSDRSHGAHVGRPWTSN